LDLSTRTVESRRHEVFVKMGVESVAELVRLAIDGQLTA
jgi:FixJ family two-component response regulator